MIQAIKIGMPTIGDYLESRLLTVSHTFDQKSQKAIRSDMTYSSPSMDKYGMLCAKVWTDESSIQK